MCMPEVMFLFDVGSLRLRRVLLVPPKQFPWLMYIRNPFRSVLMPVVVVAAQQQL